MSYVDKATCKAFEMWAIGVKSLTFACYAHNQKRILLHLKMILTFES